MFLDIVDNPNPQSGLWSLRFSGWLAGAVVAAGGVDVGVAEELAGGAVDDAHVKVGEQPDVGVTVEATEDGRGSLLALPAL
jgi:hypothetical protein